MTALEAHEPEQIPDPSSPVVRWGGRSLGDLPMVFGRRQQPLSNGYNNLTISQMVKRGNNLEKK